MKLKSTIFLLTSLLISTIGYSQNGRKYTYDNAGNRIHREPNIFTGMILNPNNNQTVVNNLERFELNLYPNTTEGQVTIDAQKEFMDLNNKMIYVYDVTGRMVLCKSYSEEDKKIDLSKQETGVYLVKLITSEGYSEQWNVLKR